MIKTISNFKYYVLAIKRNILSIFLVVFTICLVIFSNSNLEAAKSGLSLWANSVVPSLLPFFIATELLSYTNVISIIGRYLNKIMRPIFNVPGEGAFPFIMGIISGYPTGAKIVSNLKEQGICSDIEAERLLAFTNNSGPLFILGTVGVSLFGNTTIGFLLLFTHILACITVGILFRFWKKNSAEHFECFCTTSDSKSKALLKLSNLGEIIASSIKSSISTIVLIGGFVVLFSVILSILDKSNILATLSNFFSPLLNSSFSSGLIKGFIELTNGVKSIALIPYKNISLNIILCAFLLGFGGISVLLQVFSITSKAKISILPYFVGKLLQGIFAAVYTYLIISNFVIFNFNLL